MAAGIGNPLGAVMVADGGTPRIITMYAKQNISGGALVYASGTANAVSSGLSSYTASDITCVTNASGLLFTGVALQDTASGNPVPVATRGIFILPTYEAVVAGYPVNCEGTNAVGQCAADDATRIGRALTGATSGNYVLVDIQG